MKEGYNPPCNDCKKPKYLDEAIITAWKCWTMCNKAGRNEAGEIRQEAIIQTLSALDGEESDINKVLKLEEIAQEKQSKDAKKR